jgi:hypothetical protein
VILNQTQTAQRLHFDAKVAMSRDAALAPAENCSWALDIIV